MEGLPEVGGGIALAVSGSYYKEIFQKIVDLVASNAVLSLFLFGGLIAMGWRHFRLAKRACR